MEAATILTRGALEQLQAGEHLHHDGTPLGLGHLRVNCRHRRTSPARRSGEAGCSGKGVGGGSGSGVGEMTRATQSTLGLLEGDEVAGTSHVLGQHVLKATGVGLAELEGQWHEG